jgi:hypothetical protein
MPAGVVAVPAAVSVTVAAQSLGFPAARESGEQETDAEVDRGWTSRIVVPSLAECVRSPG